MSGLFSPDLKVLSDWKSSLTIAFQKLRKNSYAVEDTFTWQNFDPKFDGQGMTVTAYTVLQARYIKLNKLLFLNYYIICTLAAPLAGVVYVEVPGTANNPDITLTSSGTQQGATFLQNAGVNEVGFWDFNTNSNKIAMTRAVGGNYGAGQANFTLNTILEIR